MKFYAHKGTQDLEDAPIGTQDQMLGTCFATSTMVDRCILNGWKEFKIYTYTNIYDPSTYKLVYTQEIKRSNTP